ncbi:MAG: hypothetical protein Q8P67_10170 [archaeon]|nr:hypothetical protein [archaeon]
MPISAAAPVSQWTGQTALFYIPVSAVKALKIRLFIQLGSLPKIRLGSLVILKPGSLSEESKTPTWKDIKLSKTAPKYPSPLPAICISTSLVGGRQGIFQNQHPVLFQTS